MKLAALCHPEMDFGADGLLIGLHETGYDIFEFPPINHIRGEIDQGYLLADGSKGFTSPPGFLQLNPLPEYRHTEEELWDTYKSFDLVVMTSYRRYAVDALYKIKEKMGKFPANLVLCDGEDHPVIEQELIRDWRPIVYFKRELLQETYGFHILSRSVEGTPVFPCPFSAFTRSYPPDIDDQKKELDLCLILGHTYDNRNLLLGKFLEAAEENNLTAFIGGNSDSPLRGVHPLSHKLENMLGWEEYIRKTASAKITASLRGFGRDTLNFWEKMSFETLCLWCDPGIVIPHPFIPNKHLVEFTEDCEDISRLVRYYLNNEEERIQIARAGKEHCHRYHSNLARAEYLLGLSLKIISGEKIIPEEFGL